MKNKLYTCVNDVIRMRQDSKEQNLHSETRAQVSVTLRYIVLSDEQCFIKRCTPHMLYTHAGKLLCLESMNL